MKASTHIRVDLQVYEELRRQLQAEDTFSAVLRRLLGWPCVRNRPGRRRSRPVRVNNNRQKAATGTQAEQQ